MFSRDEFEKRRSAHGSRYDMAEHACEYVSVCGRQRRSLGPPDVLRRVSHTQTLKALSWLKPGLGMWRPSFDVLRSDLLFCELMLQCCTTQRPGDQFLRQVPQFGMFLRLRFGYTCAPYPDVKVPVGVVGVSVQLWGWSTFGMSLTSLCPGCGRKRSRI